MAPDQNCCDCKRRIKSDEYGTTVNHEGGYGRPLAIVCDDCMLSGRWDYWKSKHWPEWPAEGKSDG